MSNETYESVATQAYIAYVHTIGYAPKNANHFINFCKSQKPPFIGVNYKTARQIISQPPSLSTNTQQAPNPYLDTSLIQNINQNINQDVIKSRNINDMYELFQQKNGIHPNNAMKFFSFCETNKFNITYAECSRFLSTKPKIHQKVTDTFKTKRQVPKTSNQLEQIFKRRSNTQYDINKLKQLEKPIVIKTKANETDTIDYNGRNDIANLEKVAIKETVKDVQNGSIEYGGRSHIGNLEKIVKKQHTCIKEKSSIDYTGRDDMMNLETQIIKTTKESDTIETTGRDHMTNLERSIKKNVKENDAIDYGGRKDLENLEKQIFVSTKNYKNTEPETKQSDLRSTFLSEDKFTNNIINCTKSNGIELSDNFVHIDIDSNNPEQIKEAINVATTRAFQSRLVEPVNNITKGKLFGEMNMLLPSGLTNKHEFNGEDVYHATATFKKSDITQETFKSDMYYDEVSFNPIYKSTQNAKSSQATFTENVTNISCTIDANSSYNKLNDEIAVKLQQQHFSKMDESNKINKVYHSETIPSSEIFKISTTGPKESCRAYFTGLMAGGTYVENEVSVAYKIDACSEYVGQGEYPRNREAFPKAVASTFDGIAIDQQTRVIIYEKENFQGNKLLDAKGPKIIMNGIWKNDERCTHCKTDIFPDPELQKNFPIEVRMWTESNMHEWSYGSVKILSNLLNE